MAKAFTLHQTIEVNFMGQGTTWDSMWWLQQTSYW